MRRLKTEGGGAEHMKTMKLDEFVEKAASAEPVPGGGSIAAVCGALGVALTEMVANLTIGKDKYSDVQNEMKNIINQSKQLREKLLDDIERDANSFNGVLKAFKLPKGNDEERNVRSTKIQEEYKVAVGVPYDVALTCYKIFPLAEMVVEKGNNSAETDGLVATMCARTAVLAALYNVKINLNSIKDQCFVEDMKKNVEQLTKDTIAYENRILSKTKL